MPTRNQNQVGGVLTRLTDYPDHLRLIGLIVTDWASLEGRLSMTLWELVGSPNHGSTIFYTLGNAKARIDVVRSLALGLPDSNAKEEVLATLEQIKKLAAQRNIIAHGQWGVPSNEKKRENPFVIIQTPAKKDRDWQHIYRVNELQEIADKIADVEQRLARITEVLRLKRTPPSEGELERINSLRSQFPQYDAYLSKFL